MTTNSVPRLLDMLRVTLPIIAEWVDMSAGLVRAWQQSTYQPKPDARTRLVKAARKHAHELLALAEKVEREGTHNGGT